MAASGVGSLTAALFIAFSPRSRVGLIAGGAMLLGAAELALGFPQAIGISLLLMFFVGLGAISMAATANTTIQLAVPDQLRGRTMAVYTTVFAGSTPVGGLLMGFVASRFGVAEAMVLGGAVCAVIGVLAFVWLRRIRATTSTGAGREGRSVPGTAAAPATTARPR
jgi:predicted MFS family arabinose efflux permease